MVAFEEHVETPVISVNTSSTLQSSLSLSAEGLNLLHSSTTFDVYRGIFDTISTWAIDTSGMTTTPGTTEDVVWTVTNKAHICNRGRYLNPEIPANCSAVPPSSTCNQTIVFYSEYYWSQAGARPRTKRGRSERYHDMAISALCEKLPVGISPFNTNATRTHTHTDKHTHTRACTHKRTDMENFSLHRVEWQDLNKRAHTQHRQTNWTINLDRRQKQWVSGLPYHQKKVSAAMQNRPIAAPNRKEEIWFCEKSRPSWKHALPHLNHACNDGTHYPARKSTTAANVNMCKLLAQQESSSSAAVSQCKDPTE